MKRLLVILGFVLVLRPAVALAQSDSDWQISSFDSHITLQSSGVVQIEETIAVDFGSVDKHGIYRDLPFAYSQADGSTVYTTIEVATVTRDGRSEPYTLQSSQANLRIKI